MAAMTEIRCACGCGKKRQVRTADVKRGWGRFYSKSCKARWQERRTGQHAAHLRNGGRRPDPFHDDDAHIFSEEAVQG